MRACILSIGDELIIGKSTDTNSGWLATQLALLGIHAAEFAVVPDDRKVIAATYARLASMAELVISTGGLGPTADDLTRFGLSDVMAPGTELETDPIAVAHLEKWFRGRAMAASNNVQAQRPSNARFLDNEAGTAMGLAGAIGSTLVFALPGPPREMKLMFERSVLPQLLQHAGSDVIQSAEVLEFGMGESDAAARLGEIMDRHRNPIVGTTASNAIVTARAIATGNKQTVSGALTKTIDEIESRWQPYAFGRIGATLEGTVGELLRAQKRTLTTAESCTGGLLGSMLVRIAGSSEYYRGGWVTYSNELKHKCLKVSNDSLAKFGAVSREVATEMARGAMREVDADHALAITGIAGPDGGTPTKPVGTVFIGLATKANDTVEVRHFRFSGDRQIVRDRSAKAALQMLRFALLGERDVPLLWEVKDAPPWQRVAIALGSNVGDRIGHINYASDSLRQRSDVRAVHMSDVFETEPIGPAGQGLYLNAAMCFETTLSPRDLLAELLSIEQARGRQRSSEERNGPRTLDLDLLLYSDLRIDEPGLHVPHPRLHERRFVLEPLAQIAPNWVHPGLGRRVELLLKELGNSPGTASHAAGATPGRNR